MVGKNSKNSKIGFGTFAAYDFLITEEENRSVRIELLDGAFFPRKNDEISGPLGYVSIKLGYK